MKRAKRIWSILLIGAMVLSFTSCQPQPDLNTVAQNNTGVAVNGNGVNGGYFAKLEDNLFAFYNSYLMYTLNTQSDSFSINCDDPACTHDNQHCSAWFYTKSLNYMTQDDENFYVADADQIFRGGFESKEVIATGEYGMRQDYGTYLFGDKVACFTEDKELKIKSIADDKVIITYPDCSVSQHGMNNFFYYKDHIYFCRNNFQLVRGDLKNQELEVLSKARVSGITIYQDELYYKDTDTNSLMRMPLEGGEAKKVIGPIYSYNIKDDRIYYTTAVSPELFVCGINGESPTQLLHYGDIQEGIVGIFLFDDWDRIVLLTNTFNPFYTLNLDGTDLKQYTFPDPYSYS